MKRKQRNTQYTLTVLLLLSLFLLSLLFDPRVATLDQVGIIRRTPFRQRPSPCCFPHLTIDSGQPRCKTPPNVQTQLIISVKSRNTTAGASKKRQKTHRVLPTYPPPTVAPAATLDRAHTPSQQRRISKGQAPALLPRRALSSSRTRAVEPFSPRLGVNTR